MNSATLTDIQNCLRGAMCLLVMLIACVSCSVLMPVWK